MGHTVASQRRAIKRLINELRAYSDVLREDEQALFEQVMKYPLQHVGAMTNASSMHVWAFMLVSIIIEQEKKIRALQDELEQDMEESKVEVQASVEAWTKK